MPTSKLLLSEITSGSLASLVAAARYDLAPPPPTYIQPLDELLLEARRNLDGLGSHAAFMRGDMLEIQGPSGSGKTELLYFIALSRILPRTHTFRPVSSSTSRTYKMPVHLGGHAQTVVFFSCATSPVSMVRLAHVLREHLLDRFRLAADKQHANVSGREAWDIAGEVEELVMTVLGRVRVVRCQDTMSLAKELLGLKDKVLTLGGEEELGLVAIDGFGECFWRDKLEWERSVARANKGKAQPVEAPLFLTPRPMDVILHLLTTLRKTLIPLTLLTTQSLLAQSTPSPFPKPHFPHPYTFPIPLASDRAGSSGPMRALPHGIRQITHHITLCKVEPRAIDLRQISAELRAEARRAGRSQRIVGLLRIAVVPASWEGKRFEVGIGEKGVNF